MITTPVGAAEVEFFSSLAVLGFRFHDSDDQINGRRVAHLPHENSPKSLSRVRVVYCPKNGELVVYKYDKQEYMRWKADFSITTPVQAVLDTVKAAIHES